MRAIRSSEFRVPSSETELVPELEIRDPTSPELETQNLELFSDLRTRDSELKLIRPLLTWAKRTDTEGYCRDSSVEYRYDTMNEDTAFRRVQIRKILLPLLEDMNPKIVEVLANTAGLMRQFCDDSRVETHLADSAELEIGEVKLLSNSQIRDTVRSWLVKQRGNSRRLTLKHTEAVVRLILSEKSGRLAEIPGGRVMKSGGRLKYESNKG